MKINNLNIEDGLSRMVSAKNDYSSVAMNYDSLSRLLSETQQIGTLSAKSAQSAYDLVGNRTQLTYPSGKVVGFVPDELNRIKQIASGQEPIASYNYSGPFRVKERSYANNTKLTVGYDGNRRVIGYEHQKIEDTHHGKHTPHSAIHNPQSVIAGFEYAYDKEDNKLYEQFTHKDDKGNASVYDSIYRLTGVKYGVPNLNATTDYTDYANYKHKEDFTLDGVGNRQTVLTDKTEITYQTNNLNQYTNISSQPLSYDKNGNLISRRILLMTHLKERFGICDWSQRRDGYKNDDKCEDEDEGESDTLNDMEKDLSDCKIDERKATQVEMEWNYQYDYANRLMKVTRAFLVKGKVIFTREVASYTYDALGRRISKTTSNFSHLTSHFYYDGTRVIEEYRLDKRNREELSAQYVYGNGIDEVLIMTRYKSGCGRDKDKAYYYHENALGSIYAVTNDKGKVVERYEYTVYGEVTITGPAGKGKRNHSTIGNRFMFTGREYDSETGLHYYRARYYSPEMGRFLQRDPIGYSDGMNLYEYVHSNPLKYYDPFGAATKQPMGKVGRWQRELQEEWDDPSRSWVWTLMKIEGYSIWNVVSFGAFQRQDTLINAYESDQINESNYIDATMMNFFGSSAAAIILIPTGGYAFELGGGTFLGSMGAGAGMGVLSSTFQMSLTDIAYYTGGIPVNTTTGDYLLGQLQGGALGGIFGGGVYGIQSAISPRPVPLLTAGQGQNPYGAGPIVSGPTTEPITAYHWYTQGVTNQSGQRLTLTSDPSYVPYLSLPYNPTGISSTVIPTGTYIQVSTVAPAFGQPGGGIQIQILNATELQQMNFNIIQQR
jgi:RHS repeat-associated protein